jgi:hypothetical protein
MQVAALTPPMLNYWVAKSRGVKAILDHRAEHSVSTVNPETGKPIPYQPSIDWSQAGPILADEWYEIETVMLDWFGPFWSYMEDFKADPLTWFMRAYVAAKFGEEVEQMPEEEQDA